MRAANFPWTPAVVLSIASLLSFLARTFLDYGFVYQELSLTNATLGVVTLFNLAFIGGWIWALVSASHGGRRAMFALLLYDALLVLFGLATLISFCPSPCQTAWPVGEVAIWSNILAGVPATFMVARNLLSKSNQVK